MSKTSNLDQIHKMNECDRFESWKESNLEVRRLREELKTIPNDDPQHTLLKSRLKLLLLKKKEYMDFQIPPTFQSVPMSIPTPEYMEFQIPHTLFSEINQSHPLPIPKPDSDDNNIMPITKPDLDEYKIVSDLLHIDDKLILGQLDHCINEFSSDWKGKLIFPCHVTYYSSEVTSLKLASTLPLIDICVYIGGQVFQCKRIYFSPINNPPPTSQMSSTNAELCKGWIKLCRDITVAGYGSRNPIVCNGSQKSNQNSNTNNCVFRCGQLYRTTRTSRAMVANPDNPHPCTTLVNNREE